MAAGREYEIKAVFDPACLSELEAHPLLAEALRDARPTQMLSTYFDTDDLQLWRLGFSLRLRKTHEGVTQTLKQAAGSILDRGEWEWPLASDDLDFDLLRDTPLRPCLDQLGTRLTPKFVVDVARTKFDIVHVETRIEGALDRGTIHGAGRRLPVCEIELELKQGAPRDVVSLAHRLIGDLPLTPSVSSKSERGFGLIREADTHPVKGLAVHVEPGTSVHAAFAAITAECVAAILGNAALVDTADKVEAVHRTRVAIRRLRAALLLFKPRLDAAAVERVQSDLKWIAGLLGTARDCDVHQSTVFEPAAARRHASFGSDRLAAVMRRVQSEAHEDVVEALRSARWRLLLLDLIAVPLTRDTDASAAPFEPFVIKRLRKRRKRLVGMTTTLDELAPDERHDLRKKAKALRYALSFFEDGLPATRPKRYRKTIKALGALQETLGDLHDGEALRASLRAHAADPAAAIHRQDEDGRIASVFAAGALAAQPAPHRSLLRKAERAFRRVKAETPF